LLDALSKYPSSPTKLSHSCACGGDNSGGGKGAHSRPTITPCHGPAFVVHGPTLNDCPTLPPLAASPPSAPRHVTPPSPSCTCNRPTVLTSGGTTLVVSPEPGEEGLGCPQINNPLPGHTAAV
jgi:hypothetical protein